MGVPVQNRTLAEQLSRAFALFGRLVAGAFALTLVAYVLSWGWFGPELDRSRQAERASRAALAAMIDEENGLRGYLTHETPFAEPYNRAKIALVQANEGLFVSVGSIPELAPAMMRMLMAEEKWREWANAVLEPPPDGIGPSLQNGKDLFDAYRSEQIPFEQAIDHRTEILGRRDQRATQARVALELAVFITVLVLAVRQHHAVSASIVVPVAALLRHVGRVQDGQLEATADPGGPRELRELGQGLNDMVQALISARELAKSRDELVCQHADRLRQILDASREFSESLNLRYVVGAVRASTAAVGGYERVIVWLMVAGETRLLRAEEDQKAEDRKATLLPDGELEMGQGLAGRSAKSGRIAFEGPEGHVRFSNSNKGPVRAIALPLIVGARVVGVLEARQAEPQVATSQAIEVLEMFATHAATAIEAARLHELSEGRSQMDALTRLFNRRRLDEDLDAECKRCVRYARPLAFVMLDVDYFKAFNDAHGHPQADEVLQELANVMVSAVRTTDTAYRYGGEEFCVLLRETNGADGMIFAERLRERIQQRFASGALAGVTASFGVAEFSLDRPTPRELVEAADVAMYESKHRGRNCVMLSSAPTAELALLKKDDPELILAS